MKNCSAQGQVWELYPCRRAEPRRIWLPRLSAPYFAFPGLLADTTTLPSTHCLTPPMYFADMALQTHNKRAQTHNKRAEVTLVSAVLITSANQEAKVQNLIRNTARIMKNNHESCLLNELKTNLIRNF